MTDRNRFGLSRSISAATKREVRIRCGFGCVICGLSLYDYEHFDPDFKDAERHDPQGITLLCPQCNQRRNRKVLSVETVRKANEAPRCLSQGFASEPFDFGRLPIEVIVGTSTFINSKNLISINKFPILSIRSPEEDGGPFRLSGKFSDLEGEIP